MPRLTKKEAIEKRRLDAKARKGSTRSSKVLGRRSGYAAPAPSRVPVGVLETKVQRQALRSLTPTNAGEVITVNSSIAAGTQVYNRIGHKFRTTAVRIKGHFFADYQGPRAAIVGYSWVWDKSPNGVLPAVDDIFTINAASGYAMSNTLLVDDNSDRFTVLRSVRKSMSKTALAAGAGGGSDSMGNQNNIILVDDFMKLPTWAVTSYTKQATGGVGTIAAHETGALYLVPYCHDLSTGAVSAIQLNFTTELFFAEG